MNNVLKLGKKILTVSTVFSTMLWSVGVATLVPFAVANADTCPAFQSGSLIKVSGKAAIYAVDSNGKVLYFPDGDVFKSWNVDNKYGGYTTVSQACYDNLPVPTSAPMGVNFRAGSYVVKRASSDQLYVVEPNNTLAKITSDAAKALYGASYKVMTVADVFWPNYTNRGADVTEAKVHPGMLVSNGGKNWYVNTDGSLSQVSAAGMTANRFKAAFVHAVADSAVAGLPQGSTVDALVPAVADRTQSGGGSAVTGGGTVTVGGNLTVSLAADNPGANNLASGTAFNSVLKLTFSAGSADTQVTGVTLTKSGFAANTAITGVDVVDSSGVRHGNVASSINADNSVTLLFSGAPITVKAGSSQTVTVRVNITGGVSGQTGTLQFAVASASAVLSNGTVGGSFPVSGNVFSLQNGSNAVASVTVNKQAVNASGITLNVDPTNEQDIAKFQVAETSSKEQIAIKSWTLYNTGTAADSDVQDVQLVAQDGTVLSTAQQVNKNIVFNLAQAYVIDKGLSKNFTVRAKVVNGASRTIQFEQYNDYDIVVTGVSTGSNILPTTTTGTGGGSSFPVGTVSTSCSLSVASATACYNLVLIGSGTASFNKDASSPSAAVTPGANAVVLGKWYFKPNGENMELRKVDVRFVTTTSYNLMFSGSYTVRVNGASVYSGDPATVIGNSTHIVSLSTYPVLTAGQNNYITVEANINTNAANSSAVTVSLQPTEAHRLITNDIVDNTTLGTVLAPANQISVQAGALKVTTLATPVAQTIVQGTTGIALASFELNAGTVSSGEDVRVSKVVITDTKSGGEAYANIGNLMLYDANGNQVLTTNNTSVNANTVAFTFSNPINITKTGAAVLTLKGDVLGSAGGTHTFSVASSTTDVTATGVSTGNSIVATMGNTGATFGQAMTLGTSGTVTLSLVSGSNASPSSDQIVSVGTTQVPVFAVKLTAQNEPMKITSFKLTATGTLNTVNDLVNIKLYKDSDTSAFATANQMSAGPGTATNTVYTWTATDNLLPAPIQPGTSVTIYVKADIGAAGAAVLGDSFRFNIAAAADVQTKGASSGTTASATGAPAVSAITYITPFSVLVTGDAPTAGGSQTQSIGAGTQIGRFKVTNNGNARVTITGIKFTDSGSQAGAQTFSLKYSDQNSTNYTQNTASSSMAKANSSTIDFSNVVNSFTIDGGAYRYVTVSVAGGTITQGDSYTLSVASIGDVKYVAAEADLGYDSNLSGAISGNSNVLYADGKPGLGTLVKQ